MQPAVRYARTEDGVSIALAELGEGPALVCMPPVPFSHLDAGFAIAAQRRWFERLSRRLHLVLYDARGTGLSQRDATDFSLPAMLRDLEAVVRECRLERFALGGFFNSTPAAVAFAGRRPPPELSHLVLWGAYTSGRDVITLPVSEEVPALAAAMWEPLTEAAARMWTGGSGDEVKEVARFFRECVEPVAALRAFLAARDYDATEDALHVRVPTLVLQRRDLTAQTVQVARAVALTVPGASLQLLAGDQASMFSGDVEAAAHAIEAFLGAGSGQAAPPRAVDLAALDGLTEREQEILGLVASGRSNKEIARDLDVSIHTVERHLTNLYGKIGVRSRTEAAAYLLRRERS